MSHATVLVTAYNCPDYLAECVASIATQEHPDMSVVVVDDASPDDRQRDIVVRLNDRHGWTGVVNTARVGATANIWRAVNHVACPAPDDILVFVDGDDWLNGSDAVSRIVAAYDTDPNMWLSYGSYVPVPDDPTCAPATPYPDDVIADRSFRTAPQRFNHTIAMRAFVFDWLTIDDLCDDDGHWVRHIYDAAIMFPALEMVGPHHRCLDAVTYRYRSDNADSCNRHHDTEIRRVDAQLRARPIRPRMTRTGEPCE